MTPSSEPGPRTIIVSGLSGSGKSTAIGALEDIGFFCIDNLPVVLLEQVMELREHAALHRVAVVMDIREKAFLAELAATISRIRAAGNEVETLFLSCSDEVLIRRFKATRRRHPLQGDGSIQDGLVAERMVLDPIFTDATWAIDTSTYNVHELRRRIQELFRGDVAAHIVARIESFGFKHGTPRELDYVFDVRFLPNPYFVDDLRPLTGLDARVAAHVLDQPDAAELLDRLMGLLQFVLPLARREGKSMVSVGIGCTGGQHRSVAIAERLAALLEERASCRTNVVHRDINRG